MPDLGAIPPHMLSDDDTDTQAAPFRRPTGSPLHDQLVLDPVGVAAEPVVIREEG